MRFIGVVASSVIKKMVDAFNRTTSGSLGMSDNRQMWSAIRGVWYADGSQAKSDDASSNNSIVSVDLARQNVTVSASVSSGVGPVFWLTSAGSWWAAVPYATETSYSYACNPYPCNPSTCYQTCYNTCYETCYEICQEQYNCVTTYSCPYGGSLYYGTYCATGFSGSFPTSGYNAVATTNCETRNVLCNPYSCNPYQCNPYNCNPYPCNYQTCYSSCTGYTQNYYLRLLQSVSGTVSTATSDVSLSSAAVAIMVQTSGNTITAKAYSNTSMTAQLGSTLTYTPSNPTKGTQVGLVKYTSPYNQGSTADNFLAQ